jgi:hypothetical protein
VPSFNEAAAMIAAEITNTSTGQWLDIQLQ